MIKQSRALEFSRTTQLDKQEKVSFCYALTFTDYNSSFQYSIQLNYNLKRSTASTTTIHGIGLVAWWWAVMKQTEQFGKMQNSVLLQKNTWNINILADSIVLGKIVRLSQNVSVCGYYQLSSVFYKNNNNKLKQGLESLQAEVK